ncbi:unnamed protein product [Nezara viridula]|uniref:Odorant receptor n=1 Tax=Nezara viridula TaxID=85310 RepID=A0A9P0E466_NEZVI|nr:unnamed protein product [Nezara viridula]
MRKKLDQVKGSCVNNLRGFFKTIVFLIVWVSFNLTAMTIVVGLVQQEPIYLFPVWHPFDINNLVFQIIILLWQQYFLSTMIFMAFGGGSMLYIPYVHIKSEVNLLKYALRKIESRAHEMARKRKAFRDASIKSKVLSECYKKCLKMCVEHHLEILGYFYRGKRLTGIIYTTGFFSGVIACTFGGYNITSVSKYIHVFIKIQVF